MPNHMHGIVEITFSQGKPTVQSNPTSFRSPSQTIGAIIRGYKGATTKKIKILSAERNSLTKKGTNDQGEGGKGEDRDKRKSGDGKGDYSGDGKGELRFAPTALTKTLPPIGREDKVWQRNYYEHIIRDERAYHNIANYIRTNPLRWKVDKFFG